MPLTEIVYQKIYYTPSGFVGDVIPSITWVSGSSYSLARLENFNGYWTATQLSGIRELLSGVWSYMPSGSGYETQPAGEPEP